MTKNIEGTSLVALILDQFKDVTIIGLLVSVGVSFLISSTETDPNSKIAAFIEPFIIFALLVFNAIVSVIFELQNRRVQKSLKQWKEEKYVTVVQGANSKESLVKASDIKVGDTISLSKGDRSPADIQISKIITNSIQYEIVDQSSNLTLSDKKEGLIYCGAAIIKGSLLGVVKCLPSSPDSHHISVHAKPSGRTFVSQLDSFSHRSSIIIIIISLLIFALNFTSAKEKYDTVLKGALSISRISIAIIIASLPEHLSLQLKTAQSTAAKQMLDSNALCTEHSALDTIGRITVLCGNLSSAFTSGVTTVKEFTTVSDDIVDVYSVTGEGYSPKGVIKQCNQEVLISAHKSFEKISIGTMLSSHLVIKTSANSDKLVADGSAYINAALQAFAAKLTPSDEKDDIKRIKGQWSLMNSEHPATIEKEFSREAKSAVFSCGTTRYTLGAYESVLNRCEFYLDDSTGKIMPLSDRVKAKLQYKFADWSINYRNLGLAFENNNDNDSDENSLKKAKKLVWITGLALYNPLHDDAMSTVEECRNSGVRVIIVSGENSQTVCGYASKMRLRNTGFVTRQQWLQLSPENRQKTVKETDIYVEFTEDEKLELIKLLRESGEVVGMITGSVPDIMAMRAADIGVSNDSASNCICGCASILLKNDSVSAISSAVVLSRSAIQAAIACIRFIMSSAITTILVALFSAVLKTPTLLTSSSILLVALLTFPFPAFIATHVNQSNTSKGKESISKFDVVTFSTRIRYFVGGIVGGVVVISAAFFVFLFDHEVISKHTITAKNVLNYCQSAPRSVRMVLENRDAPTLVTLVLLLIHIANAYDGISQQPSQQQSQPQTQSKSQQSKSQAQSKQKNGGFLSAKKKYIIQLLSLAGSVIIFFALTEISVTCRLFGLVHLSPKRWAVAVVLCLPVCFVNFLFKILSRSSRK